ncbi:MAG: DUF6036 family nucleotidyltransferase [Elusimicrobiota bacterium]
MNPLERALESIVRFLDGDSVPYMVIGGIAGLVWGVRRATFDVDVTVWAAGREEAVVRGLCAAFQSRAQDPAGFVRNTGVLPLTVGGVPVDVVFGRLPYEEAAVKRARKTDLGTFAANVCSPEDLILHKIVSERTKDLEDVRELARLRADSLDRAYLEPRVRSLAAELGLPAIWETYASLFSEDR